MVRGFQSHQAAARGVARACSIVISAPRSERVAKHRRRLSGMANINEADFGVSMCPPCAEAAIEDESPRSGASAVKMKLNC